ncbi:MAG: hypothetical protein K8R53_06950 [Bacteroidales bacterium]|nr:hypothetical protein [Bacteroidales bacterium]
MVPSFLFSAGFCLMLFLPLVDNIFNLSTKEMPFENRRLARMPEFNISDLDKVIPAFDDWFNDNFHFRNDLILLHSNFKLNILGISPFPKFVVQGKNGWLFDGGKYLDDYRCIDSYSFDELEKFRKGLEYRDNWLKERGIKFYFVIVPNKSNIYSEYLPGFVYRLGSKTKIDQLSDHLEKYSAFRLIDLRETLLTDKSTIISYKKTDPHWNDYGAFLGAKMIVDCIRLNYPAIPPLLIEDYSIDSVIKKGDVLAGMINMNDKYLETDINLTSKEPGRSKYGVKKNYPVPEDFPYKGEYEIQRYLPESKLPKALIIRDSFSNALKKYLDEQFGQTVYIWDNWVYGLNKPIVEEEKPDILMIICIERNHEKLLENMQEQEYNW